MRTHSVDEVLALGSRDNALIVIWRGAPNCRALDGVRRSAEALLEKFPGGIGILGVSGEMPLDCADDRQRLAPLLGDLGRRMLGMASVIEGSDRMRSVMSCINLVMRQHCPLRIFSTVDEGVGWLAPLLGKTVGPAPLRHAVERLRREARDVQIFRDTFQ